MTAVVGIVRTFFSSRISISLSHIAMHTFFVLFWSSISLRSISDCTALSSRGFYPTSFNRSILRPNRHWIIKFFATMVPTITPVVKLPDRSSRNELSDGYDQSSRNSLASHPGPSRILYGSQRYVSAERIPLGRSGAWPSAVGYGAPSKAESPCVYCRQSSAHAL